MSTAGMNVSRIAKELGVERDEVHDYLINRRVDGIASWTSAKTRLTRRLRSLVNEGNREEREKLMIEVSAYVNYLFKKAKTLSNESPRTAASRDYPNTQEVPHG